MWGRVIQFPGATHHERGRSSTARLIVQPFDSLGQTDIQPSGIEFDLVIGHATDRVHQDQHIEVLLADESSDLFDGVIKLVDVSFIVNLLLNDGMPKKRTHRHV